MIISGCNHVTANGIISFFFMAERYSIVYTYPVFSHSFVNGHLGCFHVLAIVNSAAVNLGVHVSLFFLDICPGVRLFNHRAILFVVF